MQISSGLISCDPIIDPAVVTGNVGVDWTQVTIGNLLIVNGITYSITAVDPSLKILHISPNWVGAGMFNVAYVIVRDFTLNMQLPLLNAGDLEAAAIFTRAMATLDGLASNIFVTDPSVADFPVTKLAHGFKVGNALCINGGVWTYATSVNSTTALVVGIVSNVVDANTFWVRSAGEVGSATNPIFGVTIAIGQIYYLRLATLPTSGAFVNICTGLTADTGPLKVPIMQGTKVTSAFILNFARATSAIFAPGTPGLVPDPVSVSGKVLLDSGWGTMSSGIPDDSIQARHLDPTKPWVTQNASALDWDNFLAQATTTPVHAFILDLQSRVKTTEQRVAGAVSGRSIFTRKSNTSGTFSWNVPAGVQWVTVTVLSGEAKGCGATVMWDPNVNYGPVGGRSEPTIFHPLLIPQGQGVRFRLSLEDITSLDGVILPYKTTLNYNFSLLICSIGYDGDKFAGVWDGSPRVVTPYSFPFPRDTRPSGFPHAYATNVTRIASPTVGFHLPDVSAFQVAAFAKSITGLTLSGTGYCYAETYPLSFSGAVMIEI